MAHGSRRVLAVARTLAMLGGIALAQGCVPAKTPHAVATAKDLVSEGRRDGLALEDPLAIDREIADTLEHAVGFYGDPEERLTRLSRYLNAGFGFAQTRGMTLPARVSFRERKGDCLTYATLFVALSRYLDIDTYFVHVSEVQNFYERGDTHYASSHIAVAYGRGPTPIVIDVMAKVTEELSSYVAIDDASALALYHNNLAVDQMASGNLVGAEHTLRFLVSACPDLEELHNNLAVVLMRQQRYVDALAVIDGGLVRFPNYKPLCTNGIQAALGAGQLDRARELEAKGEKIEDEDPLFLFARGLRLYQRGEYRSSATHFENALRIEEENSIISAWLVRAYLSAGDRRQGIDTYARARRRAPQDPRLKQLESQFPELRAALER